MPFWTYWDTEGKKQRPGCTHFHFDLLRLDSQFKSLDDIFEPKDFKLIREDLTFGKILVANLKRKIRYQSIAFCCREYSSPQFFSFLGKKIIEITTLPGNIITVMKIIILIIIVIILILILILILIILILILIILILIIITIIIIIPCASVSKRV